jgi:hypothetical protein
LVAEVLSLVVSVLHIKRKHGLPASIALAPAAVTGVGMLVATLAYAMGAGSQSSLVTVTAALLGFLAICSTFIVIFPELRSELLTIAAATRQLSAARVTP